MSAIDVKLNVFEGPLDLLLHLIEKIVNDGNGGMVCIII